MSTCRVCGLETPGFGTCPVCGTRLPLVGPSWLTWRKILLAILIPVVVWKVMTALLG